MPATSAVALADGRPDKTWAMRGTLASPDAGGCRCAPCPFWPPVALVSGRVWRALFGMDAASDATNSARPFAAVLDRTGPHARGIDRGADRRRRASTTSARRSGPDGETLVQARRLAGGPVLRSAGRQPGDVRCDPTRHRRRVGRLPATPMSPGRVRSPHTSAPTARRRRRASQLDVARPRPGQASRGLVRRAGRPAGAVDVGGEPAFVRPRISTTWSRRSRPDGAPPRRLRSVGPRPRHGRPKRHRPGEALPPSAGRAAGSPDRVAGGVVSGHLGARSATRSAWPGSAEARPEATPRGPRREVKRARRRCYDRPLAWSSAAARLSRGR